MIRNLLFDMGGIIFRQNTEEAFSRFRAMGIDPAQYMGAYGQRGFFLDVESGTIDAPTFCERMAAATGRASISFEEAQQCWLGFLQDVPVERLHTLLELKPHYHLCLLSNTNPFIMQHMRSEAFSADGLPITHYFHSLFCSYELGICKPHPDCFRRALDADGMRAEESLFIDDSMLNIEAAAALGIQVLHVETNADWRAPLAEILDKASHSL